MQRIDNWIIATMQDAYLWLLDRTGCYCASVSLCCWVAGIASTWDGKDKGSIFIAVFFTIIVFIDLGVRYYYQGSGLYMVYNALALNIRSVFSFRMINCGILLGLGVGDAITHHYEGVINMMMFILYVYTLTICIRERKKKPFFEFKRRMAPQAI